MLSVTLQFFSNFEYYFSVNPSFFYIGGAWMIFSFFG